MHAQEGLQFTKGLCAVDEPDIWLKSLDDQCEQWIDVGEPSVDRIKKATRQSKHTTVYSFNSKASVWWSQHQEAIQGFEVTVHQFDWQQISTVADLIKRTMDIAISINGASIHFSSDADEVDVTYSTLHSKV